MKGIDFSFQRKEKKNKASSSGSNSMNSFVKKKQFMVPKIAHC
jgi:hypothetical protein